MIQLKKIGDNEFRFDGKIEYSIDVIKKVTIDGEVYENVKREIKQLSLSESWLDRRNKWCSININNFAPLGITDIIVWDCHELSRPSSQIFADWYGQSTNNRIAILWELNRLKQFGKYEISQGRDLPYNKLTELPYNNMVYLPIIRYGFNNEIGVDMKLKQFLELDFSKFNINDLSFRYIERLIDWGDLPNDIFKRGLLTDDEKLKIIERLFKIKIAYS